MGFWDKIKKGVGAIGDVAKKAAPFTAFIPGVGPVAAGLLGAGGALAGKLNDDDVSLGGTLAEMGGYGAAGYGGAKAIQSFRGGAGGGGGMRPDQPGNFAGMMGAAGGLMPGGGGNGMDLKDWLTLGTAAVGTGAGIYGDYKAGQMADKQMAEDSRRYDDSVAFRDRAYGDQRADVDWDRERRRRSGVAMNPLIAGLLGNRPVRQGSTQMES